MTTPQLDPTELLGETIGNDRYKITQRLGEGSMAHVFRAFDKHLETDVVIKVPIRRYLEDEDFRTRFYQESQLLVRLSHPHVVKIIDVGEHENIPFVVLQYLGGGSLQTRLRQRPGRQMPPNSLKDWLLDVAKALDFMDQQQIIHRDVKPGNILFDDHDNVFISDFGLTKVAAEARAEDEDGSLTAAGAIVGTPNYVAPEIVMGLKYDGRADQYSLATTVYEVLNGRPPLLGPTSSATMVNQTKKVPPLLCEVNADFSRSLSLVVHRALAKRASERFESCSQFAEAVLETLKTAAESSPGRRRAGSSAQRGPQHINRENEDGSQSGSGSAQVVSRGTPGLVRCPKCRKQLPLKPKHAGRRGRCIQCGSLLQVARNLASLKFIDESARQKNAAQTGPRLQMSGAPGALPPRLSRNPRDEERSGEQTSADAAEFILGERVFKWRISKKAAAILGTALLAVTIGAVVFVMNWERRQVQEEFEKKTQVRGTEG